MNTSSLFGSIGKEYCLYFYVLSVLALIFAVITIVPAMYVGLTKNKGIEFYIASFGGILAYMMIYLQNRLLYNMCAKTL